MLIQRLLAAIVLIPCVILCLFFLPLQGFVTVMIMICGLSAWEWSQFLLLKTLQSRLVFTLGLTFFFIAIYFVSKTANIESTIFKAILISSLIWWLIALLLVYLYPKASHFWRYPVVKIVFACFALIPFLIGVMFLRQVNYADDPFNGAFLLLYILVLVWSTDSGAYFAGRTWGKHKLAPNVSPGKTIEGFFGGVILSLLICLFVYFSHYFTFSFYQIALSSTLAIFASVLGDLTESMFKREANIKDSGKLIPGHGGILDRIDSLTAAVPIFAVLSLYLL